MITRRMDGKGGFSGGTPARTGFSLFDIALGIAGEPFVLWAASHLIGMVQPTANALRLAPSGFSLEQADAGRQSPRSRYSGEK